MIKSIAYEIIHKIALGIRFTKPLPKKQTIPLINRNRNARVRPRKPEALLKRDVK